MRTPKLSRANLPLASWGALALLGALAPAAGCDVRADYRLRLFVHTLPDQAPLTGEPGVKLVIDSASETTLRALDGPVAEEIRGLPPLDEDFLGLLIEDPGVANGSIDRSASRAYGARGPLSLDLGRESLELPILLAAPDTVGALGELDDPLYHGGIAITPEGDVWLAGGAFSLSGTRGASDRLLVLRDVYGGGAAFEEIGALPLAGAGQAAAAVTVNGRSHLLVTGGRPDIGNSGDTSDQITLIDAADGTVVYHEPDAMRASRSQHVLVPLISGQVLAIGGLNGESGTPPDDAPIERIDPATGRTDSVDSADGVPGIGFAWADLGLDGVLLCGGAMLRYPSGGYTETPVSTCARIDNGGTRQDAASLPAARQQLAMVTLRDGRVLAAGGIAEVAERVGNSNPSAPAVADAWIYDPAADAWSEIGPLLNPRAAFRLIATPDGGALAIGGVDAGASLFPDPGEPVACAERYDPVAAAFVAGGDCSEIGSGLSPLVAPLPGVGAFVLSGDGAGGMAYGVLGGGPPAP